MTAWRVTRYVEAPRQRKVRQAHPEANREYARKYYAANRDALAEKQREWRDAHPDYAQSYREAHREAAAERSRKWREANPERARAYREAHREANSEHVRQYKARKRATTDHEPSE